MTRRFGEAEPKRQFEAHEADLVEEVLRHDGYHLLMRRSLDKRDRLMHALARTTTDWDEVNRLRGELRGLAYFIPEEVRKDYPPQSEKP